MLYRTSEVVRIDLLALDINREVLKVNEVNGVGEVVMDLGVGEAVCRFIVVLETLIFKLNTLPLARLEAEVENVVLVC